MSVGDLTIKSRCRPVLALTALNIGFGFSSAGQQHELHQKRGGGKGGRGKPRLSRSTQGRSPIPRGEDCQVSSRPARMPSVSVPELRSTYLLSSSAPPFAFSFEISRWCAAIHIILYLVKPRIRCWNEARKEKWKMSDSLGEEISSSAHRLRRVEYWFVFRSLSRIHGGFQVLEICRECSERDNRKKRIIPKTTASWGRHEPNCFLWVPQLCRLWGAVEPAKDLDVSHTRGRDWITKHWLHSRPW